VLLYSDNPQDMKPLFSLLIALLLVIPLSCMDRSAGQASGSSDVLPARAADPQAEMVKFTSGIRAIFQDSRGHYWLGSDQEGLCRFDGKGFTYYDLEDVGCINQVVSIQEDEFGTVWIGTNKGVCSYRDGVVQSLMPDIGMSPRYGQWALSATDLWMVGGGTDIHRIDEGRAQRLASPFLQPNEPDDLWVVTEIAKGGTDRVWIASYGAVVGYDGADWTLIQDSSLGFDGDSVFLHIRSIYEDSRERLWIGNNGIGVLLRQGDTIVNFSEQMGLVQHTPVGKVSPPGTLMHVFAIGEDAEGNIWFGDRDTGAWRFDGRYMENYDIDPALTSKMIWDIYRDPHGNLLFGMAAGGVYLWDEEGFARVL
jgi:hypothetical protein